MNSTEGLFLVSFVRRTLLSLIIVLAAGYLMPFEVRAVSVETGFQYTTMEYKIQGTVTDPSTQATSEITSNETTTSTSVSLTIRGRPFKNYSLELTIPYLYQTNSRVMNLGTRQLGQTGQFGQFGQFGQNGQAGQTGSRWKNLIESPVKSNPEGNSNPNAPSSNRSGDDTDNDSRLSGNSNSPSGNSNSPSGSSNSPSGNSNENNSDSRLSSNTNNDTESGIGDITLFSSYMLTGRSLLSPSYLPALHLSAGIKFPTADPDKGLGTGEYDYTFGLGLRWNISITEIYLYGDYTWVGDTDSLNYENITSFGCRTEIAINSRTRLQAELSGYTSLYSGNSEAFILQLGIEREILSRYWIRGYGFAGLNEASPNYGFGTVIGVSFDKP